MEKEMINITTQMLLGKIAEMSNVNSNEVLADFIRFNAEIDRVKEELGLSEDEAIAYVSERWKFPFMPNRED